MAEEIVVKAEGASAEAIIPPIINAEMIVAEKVDEVDRCLEEHREESEELHEEILEDTSWLRTRLDGLSTEIATLQTSLTSLSSQVLTMGTAISLLATKPSIQTEPPVEAVVVTPEPVLPEPEKEEEDQKAPEIKRRFRGRAI